MSMSPTSPTFSRGHKGYQSLALVEDPLLATAASYPTAPTSPDPELDAALGQISGKEQPEEDEEFVEDLNAEMYDAVSVPDQEPNHAEAHLVTHAKVYAIAEKYGIRALKALAKKKFAAQTAYHWDSPEFPLAMQEAYESTIDTDRGLRDIVINMFRAYPEIAQRKDVEAVVRETPGLAWELFRVGWGLPITTS